VSERQRSDKQEAFQDNTLPSWYQDAREPNSVSGKSGTTENVERQNVEIQIVDFKKSKILIALFFPHLT
jgi:hypothetical protein